MRKAKDQKNLVEIAKELPEEARDLPKEARDQEKDRAEMARSNWAAQMEGLGYDPSGNPLPAKAEKAEGKRTNGAGVTKKSASKKAKAKQLTEKITPASIFRKLIAFGKIYQIEEEQDFREAARIYSEEAALIDQMRKRLKEDGLTVMKTYKTGDCEVAHPLLSELPRHVESANKCLMTISSMIEERGAKKQKPTRELDQFRLHA